MADAAASAPSLTVALNTFDSTPYRAVENVPDAHRIPMRIRRR